MTTREEAHLAPYAIRTERGGARRHPEPSLLSDDPFELDRHRIVTCTAFRRLEGKTQVFAPPYHDHFRTRMTHTLEVAHTARLLARRLGVSERLTECIALAHDLGHPPFGHAGEAALDACMKDHGGFNHNVHALRVVEELEHPFPPFRGLNLTRETRAGLYAHATPYDRPGAPDPEALLNNVDRASAHRRRKVRRSIARAQARGSEHKNEKCSKDELPPAPSVEAQIASLADRLTYALHDLEDAIGAELVAPAELEAIDLWKEAKEETVSERSPASIHAVRRPILDAVLRRLLHDAVEEARRRLSGLDSVEAVRSAGRPVVTLSQPMEARLVRLEQWMAEHVYRHETIARMDAEGQRMIRALFAAYLRDPRLMPERFARRIDVQGIHRVVCDYIAGMTDRFCRDAFRRCCGRPDAADG
ncbi:MAG: dNTP triphosphohydrolase [Planctomycetota bacterium]|nr:MAG: dNTP triphosphohydrolase [Planctomycetota bacterium]